jgi:5-methylthioadenosine/S-adenosylhomocysteine deaminase
MMNKLTPAPQTADHLISASWIIPVIPKGQVLENHAIIIKDQTIIDILPIDQAKQDYLPAKQTHLPGQALLPGLINAHGHAPMALFRGMADDFELMDWLEHHIWPAEHKWVDAQFVHDGAELAIAEMLMSGTTCFHDMYFYPEVTAKLAHSTGIRALITFPVFDFPSAWGQGPDDYIHKGLQLFDDFKHSQYVNIGFGPHAPYTISNEPLQRIATYAAELDMVVQMHLHETAFEVETALRETGKRPIQRLHDLGLLGPRFQGVHMTQLNQDDIALLKSTGSHVIHCPESNLKLASGFCPVQQLLSSDINVALGTDGAASNNDLDLFGELKTAALIAKAVANDATAVDAHTALAMATIHGAIAMGIEDQTGSLEFGKQADIIAVDLSHLSSQPVYDPTSHLAYANCGHQVSHVWIAGHCQLQNGKLTGLNQTDIREKAQAWQQKIDQQNHLEPQE